MNAVMKSRSAPSQGDRFIRLRCPECGRQERFDMPLRGAFKKQAWLCDGCGLHATLRVTRGPTMGISIAFDKPEGGHA